MSANIMNGLPTYVRMSIYAQVRRLLTSKYFSYHDKEDLVQDLLLFYLEKFYQKDVDEALVVHSLKNHASNMFKKRFRSRLFLCDSLDYTAEDNKELPGSDSPFFEIIETKKTLQSAFFVLNEREKEVCLMIMNGASLDEVARKMHMSKSTIYKVFEKMKKNYKY